METNATNTKQEKSSQGSNPRSSSRKQDLTWNYVSEAVDSKGKKVTACNFCGKQYVGISSMKQHLAGLNQSKTACKEVSSEVRDSIIKSLNENKEKTKDKIVVDLEMNDYEEVNDGQSSQQACTSQSRKRKREATPGNEKNVESAKQHIDRIRRTKFSIGGEENPLIEDLHQAVKNLSAELYTKDVHFLMELIQNAEDNEYPEGVDPSLEFVITSDDITATGAPATLLIFNNEKGFSDKNIESICSVGRSTKKGNRKLGYIGEKGIGFKSVFLITSQPYIFSNGYQITFNEAPCSHCGLGYIVPEWVEQHPSPVDIQRIYGSGSTLPTTTIILPLKSDKVNPVKEQLSNVHPEVLLFLSKIKNLSIREHCQDSNLSTVNSIGILTETDFMKRKSIDADSYTIHLSASETDSEKQCSYYMWRQKFPVKQENRVERRTEVQDWVITLAFPLGDRLGRGSSSPGIYAFLPTEMVTTFPFIIQADFILASSRETILLDDKWNQGILSCVPLAFVNAFTTLVKKTDAPISSLLSTFRFLPVKQSSYARLNVVRDSIRERICSEEIVPSVSHLKQKFFRRPCEVGRLIPAFWDILEKARRGLQNISSHGVYVLDSSFDKKENNDVLDFLSLKEVSNEWYARCIQGCDLVTSVSESTYVEILLFIAQNWEPRFKNTNMVKVPLIKYQVQKGGASLLSSLEEFGPPWTLCLVAEKNHSWLLDWNGEFECMSDCVFLPHATRKALNECSTNMEAIRSWLREKVTLMDLSVSLYAQSLCNNLKKDKRLVVAYAHFLHHSISKGFLSDDEAKKCCEGMPLVDNYGTVKTGASGVLVPASAGKWVSLTGSNPWRQDGYIELSEEYMTSGMFAGVRSKQRELLGFLKGYAKAADIPELAPPNAALPVLSGALQKQNAFLLLEWTKSNRNSLPPNFIDSVKEGSWLRTKMNGSYDYRPPSQSFYNTSSWGTVLKNASILVDIPLVDKSFYGKKIELYKEELRAAGVMFEFSQACTFVGDHLMSLAGTSSLSKENVFSILKFIRHLREKLLSPDDFITSIKGRPWMKTTSGDRSPDGAVLFCQEWKAASLISEIPFIDGDVYGESEISGFKEELKLLGVVVEFPNNHSLIVSHLKPENLNCLTADAMILVLECIHNLSSQTLVDSLRNSQCLKTKSGYKTPAECFLSDQEQTCFLTVFDDVFPLIDDGFYGSRVGSYKKELEQIGVVVQVEEAVKAFVRTFKQKATSSGLSRDNALSLLSCYKKLMGSDQKLSEELMKSYIELQWLHTKLGDFRAPKECILFYSEWEPLRLIANLPFIDDSKSIHSYKIELKSLGVTVELKQGMDHLVSFLSLPDGFLITPSSALSLLKCVTFLIEDGRKLSQEFLDKVSVRWLKTHAGYRSPNECLLFDKSWELETCDGPFIDEKYYGSKLKAFKKELIEIGVVDDPAKASQLLATHVYTLSDSDAISRIYRFLSKSEWKQEKDSSPSGRIWIPGHARWADVSCCVVSDKDKLFGSHLHVLENHYKSDDLLDFFSSAFDVRRTPWVKDYCALWKDWEKTKDRLSYHECCAFWSFLVQYGIIYGDILSESFSRLPVKETNSSNDEGILLSSKSDVFIADDLLLKDLFIDSPVFVWCPTPSIPTLSQTKLMELYRKLGVKDISKCVETAEAKFTDRTKIKKQENNMIGPGLVRLVLGFLSDPSLKIEAEERSRIIRSLVTLNVLQTPETISTEYTLTLPSKGEKPVAKAKKMMRWEREEGVVYAEKIKKTCGKRKVLEYATCFADVIAKGVMSGREDLIERLAELVKMAYMVEFDGEALEFLMKSKNLQVYEEDEKLISDAFSLK
ncbi:hypothetical protein Bca4012_020853 [Brassica carinata]